MKRYALVLLSLVLSISCSAQPKNNLKKAVLEYTASSRGFYQKITIENQMVTVSKNRDQKQKEPITTKISDKDWKELIKYFKTISLDSLEMLKAPTQKRFHDGAAIAHFKVIYKDKTVETDAFDHGYPPEAIKELVTKINSFAKKE
jgi:hypothetical protein